MDYALPFYKGILYPSSLLIYLLRSNHILDRKSKPKSDGHSNSVRKRKRSHGHNAGGGQSASGLALLVGSVMDNIPENMALGISLVTGGAVNIVLIAAIFISNFPEGLAFTEGMKSNGGSKIGLAAMAGFTVAFILGRLAG